MLVASMFPKKWDVKLLGECVDFLDHLRKPVTSSDRVKGDYPYYGANGVQGTINDFIFDDSLILLAEDGGHFCNFNRTISYIVKGKFWVNNHAHVLKPKSGVDLEYLCRVLEKYDVSGYIKGATRAKLSKTDASRMLTPLPPLETQKQIARVLATADQLRKDCQQIEQELNALAQSVFLEMFVKNDYPLSDLKAIASSEKHSLSSGPFGSSLTSKHYVDNGVLVLRGLNISKGKLNLNKVKYIDHKKAKELERSKINSGDIVIIAVGSSGKAFEIPTNFPAAVMSQNFNKITPDKSKVSGKYLQFCINNDFVQRQFNQEITDTVRTFLSLTKIKTVKIPLPPIDEQQNFCSVIEKIDELKLKNNLELSEKNDLFNSLLQKAFKGELNLNATL